MNEIKKYNLKQAFKIHTLFFIAWCIVILSAYILFKYVKWLALTLGISLTGFLFWVIWEAGCSEGWCKGFRDAENYERKKM